MCDSVRVPDIVPSSSSGLDLKISSNSAPVLEDELPLSTPEDCQTSYSPPSPANTPLFDTPREQCATGRKLSPMFGLRVPAFRSSDRPLERWDDLTARGDCSHELEPPKEAGHKSDDVLATPRKPEWYDHKKNKLSNSETPPFVVPKSLANDSPSSEDSIQARAKEMGTCDTCQAVDQLQTRTKMAPCGVSVGASGWNVLVTNCITSILLVSLA